MKNYSAENNKQMPLIFRCGWYNAALALIGILSFGLNFYAISQNGYGNVYYAAAVKSMSQSLKNFFFVSFDPAGLVSVDKPPMALWIQVLFVKIFGYHGWAMLLPQALAGTGSCLLIYVLTSKHFGRPAGLTSALVFAITPAVVVASRNNTMDMQLIFVLLVAVWLLFKSIESGKWRYLFLASAFVGLGFNIKMLQAYLVLPAAALVYLIFAKGKFVKRLIAGVISILILAVVSFSWVIAVDLYPSGNRPYVDSSTNNTVMELIIGHNGLERIYGQQYGSGGIGGKAESQYKPGKISYGASDTNTAYGEENMPGGSNPEMKGIHGTPAGMPQGSSGGEIGNASVIRLWSSSLYGQASWLIIFAIFGIIAFIAKPRSGKTATQRAVFVFWALWFLTMGGFFSFAGFYHRYYLCMMAPGIAALCGIGLCEMAREFKNNNGWRRFLLPASILCTILVEFRYVWNYISLRTWLIPLMAALGIISLVLLLTHYKFKKPFVSEAAAACMFISILAAPFYWALTPVMYVPNSTMPYAGPELASQGYETGTSASPLEKYLVANYKEGSYLVVAKRSDDVAQFIIDTGLPAVAYGGFLGSDNSLTIDDFKKLISEGRITYFLVSSQNSSQSDIESYVMENATLVDPAEYGGTESGGQSLYVFKQ